jgi:hypothetical protein
MFKAILTGAIFTASLFSLAIWPARAQHAGGITQCLAGCAKSDKPCEDHCVPAGRITAKAHSCIVACRHSAREPDLVFHLHACINDCLKGSDLTH